MNSSTELKVGVASVAVVLGCAYFALKKRKIQDAAKSLKNLTIILVSNEETCDQVVTELMRRYKTYKAIGFDCEWVMNQGSRNPVALLQLSTYDGYCGLFRLNQMKTVPNSLKNLLENPAIYKLGVAPADDAKYLSQDYQLFMNSTLDIRYIAELCGHKPAGLGALSKTHLGIALDKSWRIRCSDWEAVELSTRQVNYAAADAHVAIKIFVSLLNEYGTNSWTKWLWRSKHSNVWENLDEICQRYVDLTYRNKQSGVTKQKNGYKKSKEQSGTLSKRYPHSVRKSPLYHNCFLEAPDGELLCTIDNKKALWYVEKELADTVSEDPLTVRLRFEPAGRSVGDVGKYYQLSKENKCVVCGSDRSYIRKNVVPREYRKYFPEIMKEHSSHDVVLLCSECHKVSNIRDQQVRVSLALRCAAPLSAAGDNAKYREDAQCRKIRSAARALLQSSRKTNLPAARKAELERILLEFYPDCDEITEEFLKEAAQVQIIFENEDYESHGNKVVEYFLQNGGLLKLEEVWREHFLNTMHPRFLPPLWSIKHNEERLRIKFDEGRLSQEDMKLVGITDWC